MRRLAVPAVIALILPLISFQFLGLGDYGRHLATAFILKQLALGDPFYGSYFAINLQIQPYLGVQLVLSLLSLLMDVELAGRLLLILFVVLLPVLTYRYEKIVRPRQTFWWILSFCLVYTWHFNMGFLPYLYGLLSTLLSARYFYDHTPVRSFGESLISALLLSLCYVMHLFAFCVSLLMLFMLGLPHFRRSARPAALYAVAVAPSAALLGIYAAGMLEHSQGFSAVHFDSLLGSLKNYIIYTFFTYSKWLDTAIGIVVLGTVAAHCVLNHAELREICTQRGRARERSILATVLVLILLSFALPYEIGPLFFSNARLTPFIIILAIPLLRRPSRPVLASALIAGVVAIQVVTTLRAYDRIDRIHRAVAMSLDLVEPFSEFVPVVANMGLDGYHAEPFAYFWVYYMIRRNAVAPCLPAGSPEKALANSPLLYKRLFDRSPGLWPMNPEVARKIVDSGYYRYVLLWKSQDDAEESLLQPIENGYRIRYRSPELVVGEKAPFQ